MTKRVARTKSTRDAVHDLEQALIENGKAFETPVKRKKWSSHDLKNVKPLTFNQIEAFQVWFQDDANHLAMLGSAGCGKSFLAIYFAMTELLRNPEKYHSIKIVRSIVQTRQIGALPGTVDDKKQPIFEVYNSLFAELFNKEATLKNMVDVGLVELVDTSYLRGATWNNCIVFVDEINNMNMHEINTVMTRVGKDTRIIIAGDEKQSDLAVSSNNGRDKYEHLYFMSIIRKISSINVVEFGIEDIIRSNFCKQWIVATQTAGTN
jgi:phosphate starvation-inducible PhoH-like protein